MNILNLKLVMKDGLDKISNLDLGKKLEVIIDGQVFELVIDFASTSSTHAHHEMFSSGLIIRSITGTEYNIQGTLTDKTQRELREAREDVRKKQKEFKEAQRKLSSLMSN